MSWSALFGVFLLSHLFGDFLLQTDWQATNKWNGLRHGTAENRRALALHGLVYTLGFVPALVWVGIETSALEAVGIAALIAIPHVVVDDGTLLAAWIRNVKHVRGTPGTVVRLGADQSAHLLCLALAAFLVTG
jgi:Protein of unknown function (DUF3307)